MYTNNNPETTVMEQLFLIIKTSSEALPSKQPDPTYPNRHGNCLSVTGRQLSLEMTTRQTSSVKKPRKELRKTRTNASTSLLIKV